jgi:hypothetical protein
MNDHRPVRAILCAVSAFVLTFNEVGIVGRTIGFG